MSNPTTRPRTSYDEVPYLSLPSSYTHPARSAAIAALFGLTPPAVSTARILELGCSTGGNLLPLAEIYPQSAIVGVDLSHEQISHGTKIIQTLGLKNIRLLQQSIADLGENAGAFDFIICHGVFSWVPRAVQDKIMEVCARHLSDNGIAYIDYNTYPGWHSRSMVREMMEYHVRDMAGPGRQVAEGRSLIQLIAQSAAGTKKGYRSTLEDELVYLADKPEHYIFHEYLEEENAPIYLHEFVERAREKGLEQIADSRLDTLVLEDLPPAVSALLKKCGADFVRQEQYLDFLVNRVFRRSLLCHQGANVVRTEMHERVDRFHIAATVPPIELAANTSSPQEFKDPQGRTFRVSDPTLKALVNHLSKLYPQTVLYRDLEQAALPRIGPSSSPANRTHLKRQLLLGFCQDLFTFFTERPPLSFKIAERPVASPLARYQATIGDVVSSFHHRAVRLGPFDLQILRLLDGNHSSGEIVGELMEKIGRGELSAAAVPSRDQLAQLVAASLERFRGEGLLR